jgi:hypothetical protein
VQWECINKPGANTPTNQKIKDAGKIKTKKRVSHTKIKTKKNTKILKNIFIISLYSIFKL